MWGPLTSQKEKARKTTDKKPVKCKMWFTDWLNSRCGFFFLPTITTETISIYWPGTVSKGTIPKPGG